MRATVRLFYMGLALDKVANTLTVTAMKHTAAEVGEATAIRAPGLPWVAIAMHHSHKTVGHNIATWLVSEGLSPEDADRLVRDLAKTFVRELT